MFSKKYSQLLFVLIMGFLMSLLMTLIITFVNTGIVGDVDFEEVSKVAKAITPVPGGVGPMTISCLLSNTVECFKKAHYK